MRILDLVSVLVDTFKYIKGFFVGYKKVLLVVLFLDIIFFAGYAIFRNIYVIMTIKFVSGIFATHVPAVDMITKESPPELRIKHYFDFLRSVLRSIFV